MVDLSAALQAQLTPALDLLDGAVTTAKLADGAVTTPKLADAAVHSEQVSANSLNAGDLAQNSVGSSELAAESVLAGDIGPSAINGSELASNSVQGDEVENGSLNAVDVGQWSGSANANIPGVGAGSCNFALIDPTPGAESIGNRAVLVTPGDAFGGNVSFHAEAEGTQIRLKACNPSGVDVDPDGPGGATYSYIVFG